jgi:hypothetical protein
MYAWRPSHFQMPRVCPDSPVLRGFRWLHANGTTIGSYTNGNRTFIALHPVYPRFIRGLSAVYPDSSNVFEFAGRVLPLAQGRMALS